MEAVDAHALEAVAARAWPALVAEPLGGWTLRFSGGGGRRVNSVLPLAASGALGLDERISASERFYAVRGAAARFQLSPAAAPAGLEAALRRREYRDEAPTDVLVCDLAPIAAAPARVDGVAIGSRPGPAWLAAWERRGPQAEAILERVPPPAAFATMAGADGAVCAIGRGAVEASWLGVFDMATRPEARRRGAATAVLVALARWGRAAGARRAYLQVEVANDGASAFYRRFGFARHHGYRFLVQPPA